MLVLSRHRNESIIINDDTTMVVVEVHGNRIRLGIEAPQEVAVSRRHANQTVERFSERQEFELHAGERFTIPSSVTRQEPAGDRAMSERESANTLRRRKYFIGGFELSEAEDESDDAIVLFLRQIDDKIVEHFERHPEHIHSLPSRAFEEFIAQLFEGFGYNVQLTPQTRDGGRDIIAIRHQVVDERLLVECKRHARSNPVGVSVVRQLYGVAKDERATCGVVATTSFFTHEAKSFLARHEWELHGRDFEGINKWIHMYQERKRRSLISSWPNPIAALS